MNSQRIFFLVYRIKHSSHSRVVLHDLLSIFLLWKSLKIIVLSYIPPKTLGDSKNIEDYKKYSQVVHILINYLRSQIFFLKNIFGRINNEN